MVNTKLETIGVKPTDANNKMSWYTMGELYEEMFCIVARQYAWNAITRKPNILIDDKPDNIKRWTEAGGIGIRFQTNEDDLEEYLFVELEKAIEYTRTFELKNTL